MSYGSVKNSKNEPELVSFDIGNGYVKWKSRNGYGSYLSAVGEISNELDDIDGFSQKTDNIILFEGKTLVYGDDVYFHATTPQIIRATSRIDTPYYRQLFASALAQSVGVRGRKQKIEVEVVLSLPPEHYFRRDELKGILAGEYNVGVYVEGVVKPVIYSIPRDRIRVIPEGVGSVCINVISELGQEIPGTQMHNRVVGVVDVGTLTTDLITLDGLKIVQSRYRTVESAIYSSIYQKLISLALKQGVYIQDYECQRVLDKGYFSVQGSKFYIDQKLLVWTKDLANVIDGLIHQHWRGGNDVELMLLTGGGAHYVYDELKRSYKHLFLASDNKITLVLANAEGGYRYGLLKRNNNG